MMRGLLLAVVGCLVATSTAAETVKEWADAFADLGLSGQGAQVSGRDLSFAHLDLHLANGKLYPITVMGDVVGAFFSGRGTFHYTSTEPYEKAGYRKNTERASSYKVDAKGQVSDTFDRALLMLSSGGESLVSGGEWRQGPTPAPVLALFAAFLDERKNDQHWRHLELMPQAALETSERPVVLVEMDASKHDVFYSFDPIRDHDETLGVLKETETSLAFFKKKRYPRYLSIQPIDRTRLDPRPVHWTLTDLDITVVNRKDRDAEVSVRQTIRADRPVRVLDYRLNDTFFGFTGMTAGPKHFDYHLKSVTDAAGNELSFARHESDLLVELPRTLAKGASFDLIFEIAGDVLFRPSNDNYWELNRGWYPEPHRWSMESFTYHAIVKVPKAYTAFSNGKTIRRWQEDGLNCVEYRETKPIQGAVILAGKYNTYTDDRDGLTVRVSSYAVNKKSMSKTLGGMVHGFIKFYERYLGEYPFSEVNLIEINQLGFGQAPAGIIFITKEAFDPNADFWTRIYSQGVNGLLAHEVAHAWWGHVAKLGDREDQWLSESIADYYCAFAMGKLKHKREFKKQFNVWKGRTKDAGDINSVYLGNYIEGKMSGSYRYDLLYNKGPYVLHALRQKVGDETFFKIMKSYLLSFEMQHATTKDFVDITSYITKEDMKPWFDRYLFGTEIPKIK